jgi:hypothetical protein
MRSGPLPLIMPKGCLRHDGRGIPCHIVFIRAAM